LLHQVGDLFEFNLKLRCQNVNCEVCQALTAKVRVFCVGVDEGDSKVF